MLDRVLVNWLHIALLDTRYVLGARSISEGGSWGSAVCMHTDVLFKHSKSDTRTHLDLVTHLKWLNALKSTKSYKAGKTRRTLVPKGVTQPNGRKLNCIVVLVNFSSSAFAVPTHAYMPLGTG